MYINRITCNNLLPQILNAYLQILKLQNELFGRPLKRMLRKGAVSIIFAYNAVRQPLKRRAIVLRKAAAN